ncbi:MAG: hypothetical protein WBW04_11085 [Nitrolancea sp.]
MTPILLHRMRKRSGRARASGYLLAASMSAILCGLGMLLLLLNF